MNIQNRQVFKKATILKNNLKNGIKYDLTTILWKTDCNNVCSTIVELLGCLAMMLISIDKR